MEIKCCSKHNGLVVTHIGQECRLCEAERELAVIQAKLDTMEKYGIGAQSEDSQKERLTAREAAGILNKEVSTLASWRCKNSAPLPYHKDPNGRIYYKRTEVMKYQENN